MYKRVALSVNVLLKWIEHVRMMLIIKTIRRFVLAFLFLFSHTLYRLVDCGSYTGHKAVLSKTARFHYFNTHDIKSNFWVEKFSRNLLWPAKYRNSLNSEIDKNDSIRLKAKMSQTTRKEFNDDFWKNILYNCKEKFHLRGP